MKAAVRLNNEIVGYLEKDQEKGVVFYYKQGYTGPAISRSFKSLATYYQMANGELFPFFSGLLSEGAQKDIQCRLLKIDPDDEFTRLVKTAKNTIGAVSIHEINES